MSTKKGKTHLIVAGIVEGKSQKEIADEAGISDRTLRRRLADPDVMMEVQAAQADAQRLLVAQLTRMSTAAADCLEKHLKSEDPAVAHRAAKTTLERMLVYQSALDQQRLLTLELRTAAANHDLPVTLPRQGATSDAQQAQRGP